MFHIHLTTDTVLAHHGPHTTLTARILDPATNDVPTGIYSAPDPYLSTGGIASTGLGSSSSGLGHSSSSGLGQSSSGMGYSSSTVTSDPYASGSSTSRDQMSSSNMSGSNQGESMGQKMMDKVSGHSSSHQSGQQSGMANDSSRDTGMSGFSTGNPNQGGDTRVPVDVQEFGGRTTDGRGNVGSDSYGDAYGSSTGSRLGDETKYNHSSGQSSTLSKIEQRLSGNSSAPSTSQGTSSQRTENSTLGGIEREVDSRIDSSGGAHGKHGISGLFNKETNKLHKDPPAGY